MKILKITLRSFADDPTTQDIVRTYVDNFTADELKTAWSQVNEDDLNGSPFTSYRIKMTICKAFKIKGYDMEHRWSMISKFDKVGPRVAKLIGVSF